MGGSGGGRRSRVGSAGSGSGSTGTGGTQGDPCDLRFRTTLAGVSAQIAAGINLNDVLEVRVQNRNGTDIAVAVQPGSAQTVGSINAADTVTLIDCIAAGRSYTATVTAVAGVAVTVRVAPS